MSERAWTCDGCGATGVQVSSGPLRRWCSERCRKRTLYGLVCVNCGGYVDGTTPGKMANRDEPVCISCAADHYAVWTPDAILCAIDDVAQERGGIPPTVSSWTSLRFQGRDLPSANNVARRFGSWNAAIVAAGYEPHLNGPPCGFSYLTPAQRAEAVRRYIDGESSTAIAADLGCAYITVIKWARRAGVEIREPFAQRAAA